MNERVNKWKSEWVNKWVREKENYYSQLNNKILINKLIKIINTN